LAKKNRESNYSRRRGRNNAEANIGRGGPKPKQPEKRRLETSPKNHPK